MGRLEDESPADRLDAAQLTVKSMATLTDGAVSWIGFLGSYVS